MSLRDRICMLEAVHAGLRFLRAGDVLEIAIDRVGVLRNTVRHE